ncbi:MAG: ATP-binding cassette domain-containing protein [Candidatus Riflebacteria bacterium]|nr:ATP-binding cassette domain-containing protein [Candidatus Riflebacteria bacterium]
MIMVDGLTKLYGDLKAIDRLSFSVNDGEIVGLLGPNGAGKTTTMKILTCFMPATYGRAWIGGHDIFDEPMAVKRLLGYLPESPPLYPEMTVQSYVDFVAQLKEVPGKERSRKVRRALEETGTWDVRNRLIAHLSRGYQQRVGLAQALVHDPKLLILDEPTTGLDPKQIIDIRELIKSLGRERTVILSTHILPEVHVTCQRILVIHDGRIVGNGTEAELSRTVLGADHYQMRIRGPREEVTKSLGQLSGIRRVLAGEASDGDVSGYMVETESDRDPREEIFRLLAEKQWPLLEMRPPEISLEQVFIKLTTGEEETRRLGALSHHPELVAEQLPASGEGEYPPRLGPVAQFLKDRDASSKQEGGR